MPPIYIVYQRSENYRKRVFCDSGNTLSQDAVVILDLTDLSAELRQRLIDVLGWPRSCSLQVTTEAETGYVLHDLSYARIESSGGRLPVIVMTDKGGKVPLLQLDYDIGTETLGTVLTYMDGQRERVVQLQADLTRQVESYRESQSEQTRLRVLWQRAQGKWETLERLAVTAEGEAERTRRIAETARRRAGRARTALDRAKAAADTT